MTQTPFEKNVRINGDGTEPKNLDGSKRSRCMATPVELGAQAKSLQSCWDQSP